MADEHSARPDSSPTLPAQAAGPRPTRRRPDLFALFIAVLVAGAIAAQIGLITWLEAS